MNILKEKRKNIYGQMIENLRDNNKSIDLLETTKTFENQKKIGQLKIIYNDKNNSYKKKLTNREKSKGQSLVTSSKFQDRKKQKNKRIPFFINNKTKQKMFGSKRRYYVPGYEQNKYLFKNNIEYNEVTVKYKKKID